MGSALYSGRVKMNLNQLHQLQPYLWCLPRQPGETRAEVMLYGSAPLLVSMDDKVLEQVVNVACLPGLAGAAMTMPDAHWGYGFPIGGVAAFGAEQGAYLCRWRRLRYIMRHTLSAQQPHCT